MDREFEKNQRQVPVSNGFRQLWPPNYPSTSPDQYERAFNFGGDVNIGTLGLTTNEGGIDQEIKANSDVSDKSFLSLVFGAS